MTTQEKKELWDFLGDKVQVVRLNINQTEKGMEYELKPVPGYREDIFNHLIDGVKPCTGDK